MKKTKIDKMEIEGVTYIPEDQANQLAAANDEGLPLVMVRTYSAGAHYGRLSKRESTFAGIEVTLLNARRVWYWDGATTLSQLAVDGTSKPGNCKFPCAVPEILLLAIEVTAMTEKAKQSLDKVEVWAE